MSASMRFRLALVTLRQTCKTTPLQSITHAPRRFTAAAPLQSIRVFSGEAKDMSPEELEERARVRDAELEDHYHRIKVDTKTDEEKDAIRRRRLIFRSKQRGWLEVDLLLGSWAEQHVPQLTKEQLDQYEHIMNQQTIDIYNYMTGKETPPPELENDVMQMMKEYTASSPASSPEAYEGIKKYMSN